MSIPLNQPRPRLEDSAAEHARLTVVPRRPQRPPRAPFLVLVSVLLVGGIAGLLLFNTSMQQASFAGTRMEDRAAALHAREQALKMRLDTMRDPQRVATRAKRLGMVPADPAFIRLPDGTVSGRAEPAQAGTGPRITPMPTRRPESLRPTPVLADPAPAAQPTGGRTKSHDTGASSPDRGGAAGTKSRHAHR